MTQDTNPFRLAKEHLWLGELGTQPACYHDGGPKKYICWALSAVQVNHSSRHISINVNAAREMVVKRMGDSQTIVSWLQHKADIDHEFLTHENIQFFRHRWLDHLAEEWDKGVRE